MSNSTTKSSRVKQPVKSHNTDLGCILWLPSTVSIKPQVNVPCEKRDITQSDERCPPKCQLTAKGFGHPVIVLEVIQRSFRPNDPDIHFVQMTGTPQGLPPDTPKTMIPDHNDGADRYVLENERFLVKTSHVLLQHTYILPSRYFETYSTKEKGEEYDRTYKAFEDGRAYDYRLKRSSFETLLGRLKLSPIPDEWRTQQELRDIAKNRSIIPQIDPVTSYASTVTGKSPARLLTKEMTYAAVVAKPQARLPAKETPTHRQKRGDATVHNPRPSPGQPPVPKQRGECVRPPTTRPSGAGNKPADKEREAKEGAKNRAK